MGLEQRRNGRYYYEKVRMGDRVISRYVGGGEVGELAAALQEINNSRKEFDRWKRNRDWKQYEEEVLEVERELDTIGLGIRELLYAMLLTNNYHIHKGQWRKKR